MKKVFITNGFARAGKDSFASFVSKYVPLFKYSSIDLVKDMLEYIGVKREPKTDTKRLLYSNIKDSLTEYDDIPFKDMRSAVMDFRAGLLNADVMFIDIREPNEISRAVKEFGAESILIKNPRIEMVASNHADANAEKYDYDYTIINNGTLEQLDRVAELFAQGVILNKVPCIEKSSGIFICNNG